MWLLILCFHECDDIDPVRTEQPIHLKCVAGALAARHIRSHGEHSAPIHGTVRFIDEWKQGERGSGTGHVKQHASTKEG